ncbi:MAG: amino acid-binding protein, partial [Raoultibacter sp.]
PNHPGGLAQLLEFFDEQDVNIEYGYCFSINGDTAIDVLKVSDPSVEEKLVGTHYVSVKPEDIYALD